MVLNFNLIDIAYLVESNPASMVIWAAFGMPFTVLIVAMLLAALRKAKIRTAFTTDTQLLLISLISITWIMGFVTQIIMLFIGVSGLRMMIIWIIMVICYFGFLMFNKKMFLKWANSHSPFEKK